MPFFIELASEFGAQSDLFYYKKVKICIVGHFTVQIDFPTGLSFGIFNGNRQLLFHLWPPIPITPEVLEKLRFLQCLRYMYIFQKNLLLSKDDTSVALCCY